MYISQHAEGSFKRIFDKFNSNFNNLNDDEEYQRWRIADFIGDIVGGEVSLIGVTADQDTLSAPLQTVKRFLDELNEISTIKIDNAYVRAKDVVARRHRTFFEGVRIYIENDHYSDVKPASNPFTCVSIDDLRAFIEEFRKLYQACGLTIIDHRETIAAQKAEEESKAGFTRREPVQDTSRVRG